MKTIDNEILDYTFKFADKAKKDKKPFFIWLNPSCMHVFTHLSAKYDSLRNPKSNYEIEEAGMAQLDDIVGSVMKKLEDMGGAENTILCFTQTMEQRFFHGLMVV